MRPNPIRLVTILTGCSDPSGHSWRSMPCTPLWTLLLTGVFLIPAAVSDGAGNADRGEQLYRANCYSCPGVDPAHDWDAGARHSGSQQGAGHHPASEGRKALSTRIQAQARNRRHAPQAHLVPQVEDLLAYTTTSEESFLGFHHAATARKPRSRTALKGTKGAAAPSWGGNRHVMGKGSFTSRHSALPAKRKLPIYQKATARN